MQLPEVISENTKCVKDAYNLILLDIENTYVTPMVLTQLTHPERLELAKGMFLAVKLLFRATKQTPNYTLVPQIIYSRLSKEDAAIVETTVKTLQSMEDDGGSFYLQLYRLPEPAKVTIVLMHIFKHYCAHFYAQSITPDIMNVIAQLVTYVAGIESDTVKHQKEREHLLELMRTEKISVEKALHVMELLAPYFVSDRTEDGEKVYVLGEQTLDADEINSLVRGKDQSQLLKATCIVSCVFLCQYLTVSSIMPILYERRVQLLSEISLDEDIDDDVQIQNTALNLLECIVNGDEEGFHLQVAGIDDIYGVIMSLHTSLYRTAKEGLHRTTKDIAASLRQLLK